MAERLRTLPTVADASIEVALPDTLRVRLVEREPIVVWQVGEPRFLVDADRVVFAEADAPIDLPVIDDRRARPTRPTGRTRARRTPRLPLVADRDRRSLDPVDFDAATRLGSLRPADVGSGAAGLHVTIDDDHGFGVDTGTDGWTASSGSTRRRSARPTSSRARSACCAASSPAARTTIATVILADDARRDVTPTKAAP